MVISSQSANVARHSTKARALYRTDISHPRRLRVKGADTESLIGQGIDSGETGIQVSDRAQATNEAATALSLDLGRIAL